MARKTYIPTLYLIVKRLCEYNNRWSVVIRANLPPTVQPAYDALVIACDNFIALYGQPVVQP